MKGDFSRQTFDPRRHYARRPDAAGPRPARRRLERAGGDPAAADPDRGARRHRPLRRARATTPGSRSRSPAARADDRRRAATTSTASSCENETDGLAYEEQPDLPGAGRAGPTTLARPHDHGLVYLDVWERHVTALDDRAAARGRARRPGHGDTRSRRSGRCASCRSPRRPIRQLAKELQAKRAELQQKLRRSRPRAGARDDRRALEAADRRDRRRRSPRSAPRPGCDGQFDEWDDLVADPDAPAERAHQPPAPPDRAVRRAADRRLPAAREPALPRRGPQRRDRGRPPRSSGRATTARSSRRSRRSAARTSTVHDLGPDDVLGFADRPVGRAQRRRARARRHSRASCVQIDTDQRPRSAGSR